MRRLIRTNTYYQLLMVIQMKLTLFKDDYITLLVSDHSRGADKVVQRLATEGIFNEIYFIRTVGSLDTRNAFDKIKDYFDIVADREDSRYSYNFEQLQNKVYDELLMYNYGIETYAVYSVLSKYNSDIKVSGFEEGILSYNIVNNIHTRHRDMINKTRRHRNLPVIEDHLADFYCFYPKLYTGIYNPVGVPVIEPDSRTAGIIQHAFDIDTSSLSYPQKYIYFTSVLDFEGDAPIGEYELVCRIADIVGKDNLLIKVHPRDFRNIYQENGFHVDTNSSAPWEAIQISGDFSDKVFLTATSTSALAGSFMSKNPVRTFYLYRLYDTDKNSLAQISIDAVESLMNKEEVHDVLSNVHIADSIEEILS